MFVMKPKGDTNGNHALLRTFSTYSAAAFPQKGA